MFFRKISSEIPKIPNWSKTGVLGYLGAVPRENGLTVRVKLGFLRFVFMKSIRKKQLDPPLTNFLAGWFLLAGLPHYYIEKVNMESESVFGKDDVKIIQGEVIYRDFDQN